MYMFRFCFLLCFFGSYLQLDAQEMLVLSLEEVVAIARDESPDTRLAETQLENSMWGYRAFQANYRPQIRLSGTLPNFNRSLSPLTLDDGSVAFINNSFMTNSLDLLLEQDLALTGGSIAVGIGLQRNDNFELNTGAPITYLSSPIRVSLDQPLFTFNRMRWEREIEPLRYEEAKAKYAESIEGAALEAVRQFFNVYTAQLSLEAAKIDKANADTLYQLSQGRYDVGRIAENELLQVELQVMNADVSVAESTLNLQSATESLRNFLSINEAVAFSLSVPDSLPRFEVDANLALERAKAARSWVFNHERRLKEAEREVVRSKRESGVEANLSANFGLSQRGSTLNEAYQNPQDQEQIRLTVSVPLADWGKAKAKRQIAASNQELVQMNVELEQTNFEREILLKVNQFDMIRQQVEIADRSHDIAQRAYFIAEKRYRIGKIGITELNQALQNRNTARRQFFDGLRRYWEAYYELRRLTLYDFETGTSLR